MRINGYGFIRICTEEPKAGTNYTLIAHKGEIGYELLDNNNYSRRRRSNISFSGE